MKPEQIHLVPLADLKVESQVRQHFDDKSIDFLAASLTQTGQLQPIRCRQQGNELIVVDGERRLRAAQQAGLPALQVIIESDNLSKGEVVQRQLISNCQREDLTPLEKAKGIAELMTATGWNASEVAQRLGMSSATISRLLTLLELPPEIQAQVAAGKIAPSAAAELAKVQDSDRQAELAGKVAAGELTRDQVAKAAKQKKRVSAPKSTSERLTAMLGLGRVVSVFAPQLSLESLIELLEELLAKARRAKTQNASLATFSKLLEDQCRTA